MQEKTRTQRQQNCARSGTPISRSKFENFDLRASSFGSFEQKMDSSTVLPLATTGEGRGGGKGDGHDPDRERREEAAKTTLVVSIVGGVLIGVIVILAIVVVVVLVRRRNRKRRLRKWTPQHVPLPSKTRNNEMEPESGTELESKEKSSKEKSKVDEAKSKADEEKHSIKKSVTKQSADLVTETPSKFFFTATIFFYFCEYNLQIEDRISPIFENRA